MAWPNWSRRSSARLLAGFQGKDVVQITFREITDIKWLRRFGGAAGDLVLTLQDGAKVPPTPRRSPRRSPPTPQPTLQPTPQHTPQPTPQPTPAVAPAACMPPPLPRRAVYLALALAALAACARDSLPPSLLRLRGAAPGFRCGSARCYLTCIHMNYQVEIRSMPEFDRNLKFIFDQVSLHYPLLPLSRTCPTP